MYIKGDEYVLGNKALGKAKFDKNDEFYTMLSTIEKEINIYRKYFEGKTVYCNCDDPIESNFSKFFIENFEKLQLKKLIVSCYVEENNSLLKSKENEAVWIEYSGEKMNGKTPSIKDIKLNSFEGNGDFRGEESKKLLKEADIVVTNPPFSLFREFVSQLIEEEKLFLILGNMNAITYKEFFPLLMNNKVWPGPDFRKTVKFEVPDNSLFNKDPIIGEDGKSYISVQGITWWTNLDYDKRYKEINFVKKLEDSSCNYPKYVNYNAINIDRVANIPKDYKGVMGVPISFIGKFNPNQFEILGLGTAASGISIGVGKGFSDRKHNELRKENKAYRRGNLCYRDDKGNLKIPYARILIRRV